MGLFNGLGGSLWQSGVPLAEETRIDRVRVGFSPQIVQEAPTADAAATYTAAEQAQLNELTVTMQQVLILLKQQGAVL